MKWASAIAQELSLKANLERTATAVMEALGSDQSASLVAVFVSSSYREELEDVPSLLQSYFPDAFIFGCSAAGVIGNGVEIEQRPAVALTVGHLPHIGITPFRTTAADCPTPDDPPDSWMNLVGVDRDQRANFLVLMDSYSMPGNDLLSGLDFGFPGAIKIGGLASGGRSPGSQALYLGNETYHDGAVGIVLTGNIIVDTVVAQGCRPIGAVQQITKCHRNILLELNNQPPLAYLQTMYRSLPSRDQTLMKTNLFLGIAVDIPETLSEGQIDEFLVRNLIGADEERGILAIGEYLQEGQLVQFHVRDAQTSADDLADQLVRYVDGTGKASPAGALLFQCNGRGTNLYGRPNHDSDLFKDSVGPIPLGGFFCNGEIGPVGRSTYLHGYTSSFAIFREPLGGVMNHLPSDTIT